MRVDSSSADSEGQSSHPKTTPQAMSTVTTASSPPTYAYKWQRLFAERCNQARIGVSGIPGVTHLISNAKGGGVRRLPPLRHSAPRLFAELQRDLQLRRLHRRHRQPLHGLRRLPVVAHHRAATLRQHPLRPPHRPVHRRPGHPRLSRYIYMQHCAVCFIHSYTCMHVMHRYAWLVVTDMPCARS
jgi:hypothetical protein